MIGNFF